MQEITSSKNPLIKLVKSLHQRKYRQRERLFITEGLRNIEQILNSDIIPQAIIITPSMLQNDRFQQFVQQLDFHICSTYSESLLGDTVDDNYVINEEISAKANQYTDELMSKLFYIVDENLFTTISDTETPQGIMMVTPFMDKSLMELSQEMHRYSNLSNHGQICLILDSIQDPGNLGNILRTAEALDIDSIILTEGCVDIYAPKVIRASMGAVFSANFAVNTSYSNLSEWLQLEEFTSYGTVLTDDAVSLWNTIFHNKTAIVMGNEANGISPELANFLDHKLVIPMFGTAESLNVATAAAVTLYEIRRQQN